MAMPEPCTVTVPCVGVTGSWAMSMVSAGRTVVEPAGLTAHGESLPHEVKW
jgi:hypothetical protein